MMRREHFMLFPSCVPVRGAVNSAIYDLGRHRLLLFPSAYFEVVTRLDRSILDETIESCGWEKERNRINQLVKYLVDSEVAFFTTEPARFPPIEDRFLDPSEIHNAIIDVGDQLHDFESILSQLDDLGCQFVQIRGFTTLLDHDLVDRISVAALHKSIKGLEFLVMHSPSVSGDKWASLLLRHRIISKLVVHSAPQKVAIPLADAGDEREVQYLATEVRSASACGRIELRNINAPSIQVYLELKQFNGCLNKKISISADGVIRNCPSMSRSFGSFGPDALRKAAEKAEFRRLWKVKKDDIEACRDCEYRYVCTDCRAYVTNPLVESSKPAKCGYDPYSGKWVDPQRRAGAIDGMVEELARE